MDPAKKNDPAMHHILRMDHVHNNKHTRGYWVRIQRADVRHSRFFSDGVYGGKQEAFAAAKAFRDEITGHAPLPARRHREVGRTPSGKAGVIRSVYQKGEHTYVFWVASWCPRKYEQQKRVFSVNKYGEEEAYRRALAARAQGVASACSSVALAEQRRVEGKGPQESEKE